MGRVGSSTGAQTPTQNLTHLRMIATMGLTSRSMITIHTRLQYHLRIALLFRRSVQYGEMSLLPTDKLHGMESALAKSSYTQSSLSKSLFAGSWNIV